MSQVTITFLRFQRSTSTPANWLKKKPGMSRADMTRAIAASGDDPPIRCASATIATNPIQSPSDETTCASQRRKNAREPKTRTCPPGGEPGDRSGGNGSVGTSSSRVSAARAARGPSLDSPIGRTGYWTGRRTSGDPVTPRRSTACLLRRRLLLGGRLLRRGLLRRRARLRGCLLRGCLLGRLLARPGLATLGEQLGRPLRRDLLEQIAAAQRRVRLAVGHVDAEPAVLGHDRTPAHRIVAELAQRRLRCPPAPVLPGLREQGERLVERDREELLLGVDRPVVLALAHERAVATVAGFDDLPVGRVACRARGASDSSSSASAR